MGEGGWKRDWVENYDSNQKDRRVNLSFRIAVSMRFVMLIDRILCRRQNLIVQIHSILCCHSTICVVVCITCRERIPLGQESVTQEVQRVGFVGEAVGVTPTYL